MALSKIKVMISSRCADPFPAGGATLSQTRQRLKADLEAQTLWGEPIFEVWINESAPPAEGTDDSWDTCLGQVRDCDILIALSNGNAGWSARGGDIGICHAELMTALETAPAKVRLISVGNIATDASDQGRRNQRFQDYISQQSLFRGGGVTTAADLDQRVHEAVLDALTRLAGLGVREALRGRYYSGAALDWMRLDFASRQARISKTLVQALVEDGAAAIGDNAVSVTLSGQEVLWVVHAVPASLGEPAAREMVGRPFLKDHELDGLLGKSRVGPVHVIGCHQGATQVQARQLIGFPDATFVTGPFGIYVADRVQNIQFVFLPNCRDETTTRHGLQRLLEWLSQSGQAARLAERALARRAIVGEIAAQAVRLAALGQ